MNHRTFFLVLAISAATAADAELVPAVAQTSGPAQNITVIKRTEGEALAQGYAEAYRYISRAALFLTYQLKGQNAVTLEGFRELKAVGSVLIITTERGNILAIPATDVLSLSSERPAAAP
jgi:hypothetical protein